MCLECSNEHGKEGVRAIADVARAVRHGLLPRPATQPCADCSRPAHDYDHRDYLKPLAVVPVCRSCNQKRGPAFDSRYRPAQPETNGA